MGREELRRVGATYTESVRRPLVGGKRGTDENRSREEGCIVALQTVPIPYLS